MYKKPIAKIISWSSLGEEVCASAARISTTEGTALELFKSAWENSKNTNLIGKVLQSGHKSVIEHMTFSLALENVSVYVEQYFIEMRLASLTVKSRRYVDFGNLGYHVPSNLEGEDLKLYRRHMDNLFETYRRLLELGIPKEDARFVLPYSFCSNFYCTINARELINLIRSIRCGRGSASPELLDIADQLAKQVVDIFPAIACEIPDAPQTATPLDEAEIYKDNQQPVEWVAQCDVGGVAMTSAEPNPNQMLSLAYSIAHPNAWKKPFDDMLMEIVSSMRPRELEQLTYSFLICDITLAGLTHLTRHRIQSLVVPPIESVDLGTFIIPDTIAANPEALSLYKSALTSAYANTVVLCERENLCQYRGYFAVAGNVMKVMTTMNARELRTFIQLRVCNRAQWEIRQIAIRMLYLLRENNPSLFNKFGPSCFLNGVCPEGKMSCGKIKEIQERFAS